MDEEAIGSSDGSNDESDIVPPTEENSGNVSEAPVVPETPVIEGDSVSSKGYNDAIDPKHQGNIPPFEKIFSTRLPSLPPLAF